MQPRPVIDTHDLIRKLKARSEELASITHQDGDAALMRLAYIELEEQAKQLRMHRGG